MSKESWYINESELDDYQVRIVRKKLESSFIVKGCAGSGKTILALWRAKELQDMGVTDYLVIVYTRALSEFIRAGVDEIGVSNRNVTYFWDWDRRKGQPSADYIIVDEVQDFSGEELDALRGAARKHLILFGDSAQQLYSGWKDNLMTMEQIGAKTQLPLSELTFNHRLTKKLARVAQQVSDSGDELVERCRKEGANKPWLIKCASQNAEYDYIIDAIEAQNYEDVGILLPSNEDVESAYNYFNQKGIAVERKIKATMTLNFTSTRPKLMTYHSAKGLQFEAVFLPNCSSYDRNPLYVALTRSYRDLYILYHGSEPNYIRDVDSSLFNKINTVRSGNDMPF